MSRTKRIKEYYPTSHSTGETYAVGVWHHEFTDRWRRRSTWEVISPADRKAYCKALHERHKESSTANDRSPSRMYRKRRESQYRCWTKDEIHKFMRDQEHEVVIPDSPLSHLWDWR